MITDINEGNTNNYLIPGSFTIIIALGLLFGGLFLIGLPVLALGIIIVMATNGIEINPKTKMYRKYGNFAGYKYGSWESLQDVKQAELTMSIETGVTRAGRGAIQERTKLRTYSIILITFSHDKFMLHDFLKYNHAKTALKAIEQIFNIEGQDKVRTLQKRSLINRKYSR